jgi:site-specific recombinase XerD
VDGKNQTARYVKMSPNLIEWLLSYRKRKGKIALTRAAMIVSKDLRDKGVIESWENDVMRHSFCSYLLAKEQNISLVAEQAGSGVK